MHRGEVIEEIDGRYERERANEEVQARYTIVRNDTLLKIKVFHDAIEEPFCLNGSIKNLLTSEEPFCFTKGSLW